uniref:Uncharacterized protein n=1 Tax=viral metagenome TaxID=1070528 RepID=A0A6H1ZZ52_9ZZZZ
MNNLIRIIENILNKRLKIKLIINFDGSGGYTLETKLGNEATEKVLESLI